MALSKDTCRLRFFISTFTVLLALFQLTEAGGKTLVLVDNANTKETHSIFFNSLKGRKNVQSCRVGRETKAIILLSNQRFNLRAGKGKITFEKLLNVSLFKLLLTSNLVVVCTIGYLAYFFFYKLSIGIKCKSTYCYSSPSQRNLHRNLSSRFLLKNQE